MVILNELRAAMAETDSDSESEISEDDPEGPNWSKERSESVKKTGILNRDNRKAVNQVLKVASLPARWN